MNLRRSTRSTSGVPPARYAAAFQRRQTRPDVMAEEEDVFLDPSGADEQAFSGFPSANTSNASGRSGANGERDDASVHENNDVAMQGSGQAPPRPDAAAPSMEQMMARMLDMFTQMKQQHDEDRASLQADRLAIGRELASLRQHNTPASQMPASSSTPLPNAVSAVNQQEPGVQQKATPSVAPGEGYVVLSPLEYSRFLSQQSGNNASSPADAMCRNQTPNETPVPNAAASAATTSMSSTMRSGTVDHRRLYELPKYDGKPEEWPLFFHAFTNSTEAYGYTDLENLMRLQKALIGDAKATVQRILIHPRHVGQVMKTLEKNYGRPEVLLRSQLRAAHELPAITEDHLEDLRAFSTSVQNLSTFLDMDNTQQHLANPALLDELVGKLPMARRLDWACVAKRIEPYATVKDFAEWVEELADMVSVVSSKSTSRTNKPNTSRPKRGSNAATFVGVAQTSSGPLHKCSFCNQAHTTATCYKFLQLAVDQRWKEVIRLAACFCCLDVGHMILNCPEKRQCGVDTCTRWHHVVLHTDQATLDRLAQQRGGGQQDRGGGQQDGGGGQQVRGSGHPNNNSQSGDSGRGQQGRNSGQHRGGGQQGRNSGQQRNDNGQQRNTGVQPDSSGQQSTSQRDVSAQSSGGQPSILSCHNGREEFPLLYRVMPVVLYSRDRRIETHALLDDGSSTTIMDAALADELGLEGPQTELNVQWFGKQTSTQKSSTVSLEISDLRDTNRYPITVRTVRHLSLPTQTVDADRLKDVYKHLKNVPFDSFVRAAPKILIGLDYHHLGVPMSMAIGNNTGEIVAAQTRLGWCVYGCDNVRPTSPAMLLHIGRQEDAQYKELNELVRSYIATEDFGVKVSCSPIESDETMRARSLLASTTRRVGDRYETGLLWRTDDESLPDSHDMALRRLRSVESKMERNAEFAAQYEEQIAGYLAKGYARKLTMAEASARGSRKWFLPHFAVTNPNKPGKFRLVFDAAAKAHGRSLNCALLSGPDENVPLTRLLFRFRIGLVGVCGDIREMFHQVRVRPEDQQSQLFLWRNGDHTRAPDVYAMQVMTFGSTCSPASAQFVKNENAEQHRAQFPDAADAIQHNHYVDDYVISFSTPKDAVRVTKDVVNVHRNGGFELRSFRSNCQAVLSDLGADTGGGQTVRMEPNESPEKILGMSWNTSDDIFLFQTKFSRVDPDVISGRRRPTKREVLSTLMSVYDPFGLLADFLLTAKIMLQDLWRIGTTWDQEVPEEINRRWQSWRSRIEQTQRCRVPRCYSAHITTTTDLQLHVFCDASQAAFAAVAYWRVATVDGIEIAFVAGKTKCAPLKMLSIPRLELQAAMLAVCLATEIRDNHDLAVTSVTIWSDSQTVLQWLHSDARRYKPFVAIRVAEIIEAFDMSCWRWCPTALNVADDATRVKPTPTFDPESRWLRGPAWLRDAENNWPERKTISTTTDAVPEEVRRHFIGLVAPCSFIERFSRLGRLRRVTGWILRFVSNARTHSAGDRTRGELTLAEIDAATRVLCRTAQQEAYPTEYATVRAGNPIAATNELFKLNLYTDEDGVLRLHGRTDAASDEHLPADTKRPILLPRHHHLTRLVVQHEHERMAHQFEDATAVAVRRSFWVPQLRVLVRSVRRSCMSCRIRTARPAPQPFGQLPKDRLTPFVRPFHNTGLDYFGPVEVAVGRRREKRWVAIFTCLSVRAVHLEIAADLSTDSCLTCIRNLANLRGPPAKIRCDNGTNFVGARNQLAREDDFFDVEAMQRELSTRNIDWVFNCPSNPEAGGAWERLIQSVKRVLSVTLKEVAPRVETLRSMLLEAANILNSRPLTHLPVEAEEADPITPNHFLIGSINAPTAPVPSRPEPLPTRRQWAVVQELTRRFWVRWVAEYLPELTRRSRHYAHVPALKEGALVLICDTNQPRGSWTKGRILTTTSGPDGIVRTAEVQTASGVLRRPATRLAVLDVEHAAISATCGGRDVANRTVPPIGRPAELASSP